MNAYELADELLRDNTQLTVKAAYMLRQQADRIAELERQNEALEQLRPYWAKGFSDDSVAAQCTLSAMSELHKLLGVDNQTDAVIKIKQQADRITELEKELYFKNYYEELPDTPVGIIGKIGDSPIHDLVHRTTPQIKELSDEEIDAVVYSMDWAYDPIKFARAILKKASEK